MVKPTIPCMLKLSGAPQFTTVLNLFYTFDDVITVRSCDKKQASYDNQCEQDMSW